MIMAAHSTDDPLHFVFFPLMAQGHIIPMVDIGRLLAHRGSAVTIVTTPLIAGRFRSVIAGEIQAKFNIQLLELQLPFSEVGLPEGSDAFDRVPSSDVRLKMYTAMDLLEEPAEDLLRRLSPPPSCIISDFLFPWTTEVARRLNIPRIVFHGPGCFWLVCKHILATTNVLTRIESDSERFVLPGLPDRVEVTKLKVSGNLKPASVDQEAFRDRFREAEKSAYGIVVHTFEELEPNYVNELSNLKDKKVWCIGPVSLSNKDGVDIADRGNKAVINGSECLKWLDEKEPGLVLYVCMGSLAYVSTNQAIEVGLGLESTNRPFIWCVRNETDELKKWFLWEGFEERVRDRGLVVHGWSPQALILSHRAIGGFVTHCGWNSTMEAVGNGVPMVTWPHFGDQFLNEILVVEILKVGVRMGVEVPVALGEEEEKMEALVKKEDIKMAVEKLMDDGEEGEERRRRATELSKMAKKAMEEGGSSYRNVSSLIRDITDFIRNRK